MLQHFLLPIPSGYSQYVMRGYGHVKSVKANKIIDSIDSCIRQEKTISTGTRLTQKGNVSRLVQH